MQFQMPSRRSFRPLPLLLVGACQFIAASCLAAAAPSSPDFLRDVRPILSSHCFKCHGPDENTRKAGLRLDIREAAIQPSKSGEVAIVPGQPESSELLKRVLTSDEDDVMPPPSTKHPLTDAQKEVLKAWIAAGAEYRPHWAFIPPAKPAPPSPDGESSTNPIDAFIRARLAEHGLQPSPRADRLTLVRRLYLDLIGLPPTPEEADAFVSDESPGACEALVDRLLASPHFGERWARRWMDLARYADTNGYEKDRVRSIWPWRDWVVNAINQDKPFDQFTIEQIAGDMLPDATPEQRIATGFHRNTMINEEGGIDPLEYRFHAMVDRVSTTATTWLGLTMGCAQCHTHKYDPIQHKEYYQFMAFLDNSDEPTMEVPDPAVAERRRHLMARIAQYERELPDQFPPEEKIIYLTPPLSEIAARSAAPVERLLDGSYRVGGEVPDSDSYEITLETSQKAIALLNLDVLADDALPKKGPGRADNGNFVLSEITVTAAPLGSAASEGEVKIASATADFEQSGFPIRNAFDGKEDTGWAIAGEGQWNINRRATFRFENPVEFPEGTRFHIRLVQNRGGKHVLGRFRLSLGVEEPDGRPLAERRRANLERKFAAWKARETHKARRWSPVRPVSAESDVPVLTIEEDASIFASSDQTKSDTYRLKFRAPPEGATAIRLEVLPDERLPQGGPGRVYYEGPFGDFFLSTFTVSTGGVPLRLHRSSQTFASDPNDASKAIDTDAQSGWSISGAQGRRNVAVFNFEQPLGNIDELDVTLLFEKYYAAGLGRFRISFTTDPRGAEAQSLPDDLQEILLSGDAPELHQQDALLAHFTSVAPELSQAREKIEKLRRELPPLATTLVMHERPAGNPRITRVHHRGEFLQVKDAVQPQLPAVLGSLVTKQPRNRLEFARWLVSRENPLTARVIVNRRWQALFGKGLVRTVQDFGFQGDLPTHPDLLDWLAVEFMDQGWSMKKLTKLIVMSDTYQQSSQVTPEALSKDPENVWLARGPRVRIEAELIRDVALRSSGLLSEKMGGPSVFPPQLPSITKEGAYGPLDWKVSEGEDRYRRGLYTFAKRTAPYATFLAFDAPSGEACVARRDVSNTPLQALTLLNDEVFIEAAQALGREAAALEGDAPARARYIFRRCLTRVPTTEEVARVVAFYEIQRQRLASGDLNAADLAGSKEPSESAQDVAAWTTVARALLNLDETFTRS